MPNPVSELSRKEMYSPVNYLKHGLFFFFYGIFKYWSVPLSNYLRYVVLKVFAKKIGSTHIKDGVTFFFPQNIIIGKNSTINEGCFLHALGGIEIGNGVRIAPQTTIHTYEHGFLDASKPIYLQDYLIAKVVIEDEAWIGANVCINKGVTIGKGAVIGGGSVVTKDIPPYAVAVGNPAKVIKYREGIQKNIDSEK